MSDQAAIDALMVKAERASMSASALLDLGDVDGACNRAYYAMFDAARAALLAHEVTTGSTAAKTHSGLIATFSLHLVKPGLVSVEWGRALKRAEEMRVVADYRGDSVEPADALALVALARGFVTAMNDLME